MIEITNDENDLMELYEGVPIYFIGRDTFPDPVPKSVKLQSPNYTEGEIIGYFPHSLEYDMFEKDLIAIHFRYEGDANSEEELRLALSPKMRYKTFRGFVFTYAPRPLLESPTRPELWRLLRKLYL